MVEAPDIRPAVQADAPEIARLCHELGHPAILNDIDSRLRIMLAGENHFIAVAAGPGDSLLGWVAVEHRTLLETGDTAEVSGLVVDARGRRRGAGRALMATAERWAVNRGLRRMTVRTNVVRREAHPFYRNLGFAALKTQHVYIKRLF